MASRQISVWSLLGILWMMGPSEDAFAGSFFDNSLGWGRELPSVAWNSPVSARQITRLRLSTPTASAHVGPLGELKTEIAPRSLRAHERGTTTQASEHTGEIDAALSAQQMRPHSREDVVLEITGLEPGETVWVEKYQVNRTDGEMDSEALLMQRFEVTDNLANEVAGERIPDLPSDENEETGSVRARLVFNDAFLHHVPGTYVYRVFSPTERFASRNLLLTVLPDDRYEQSFNGRVLSNAQPVPYAYVILLSRTPDGYNMAGGTIADDEGRFDLPAPAGSYEVVPFKPGFIGRLGTTARRNLPAGTQVTEDLALIPASRSIRGQLVNRDEMPGGPAGLVVFAQTENGRISAIYTEADGTFELGAEPGVWMVSPLERSTYRTGHSMLSAPQFFTIESEDLSGVKVLGGAGTAVIKGRVTQGDSPVHGIEIMAFGMEQDFVVVTHTDDQGKYTLPVIEGEWLLRILPGQFGAGSTSVTANNIRATEDGVVEHDFELPETLTQLNGRLVDSEGEGLSHQIIYAYDYEGHDIRIFTDENGEFRLNLVPGQWQLIDDEITTEPLVRIRTEATLFLGESPEEVILQRRSMPGRLVLSVVDTEGEPVPGLPFDVSNGLFFATHRIRGETDDEGKIRVPVFPDLWLIQHEGEHFSMNSSLEVSGASEQIDVEFVFNRPKTDVTVRFEDPEGNPFWVDQSIMIIQTEAPDTRYIVRSEVGDDGIARMELSVGEWGLFLWNFGGYSVSQTVIVSPDGEPVDRLISPPVPTSELTVHAVKSPDLKPAAGIDLIAQLTDGLIQFEVSLETDDEGMARFPVFPGEWKIRYDSGFGFTEFEAAELAVVVRTEDENLETQFLLPRIRPGFSKPIRNQAEYFEVKIRDVPYGAWFVIQTSDELEEWYTVFEAEEHDGIDFDIDIEMDPEGSGQYFRIVVLGYPE